MRKFKQKIPRFLHKLEQIHRAIDSQDPDKSADQLTDLIQNVLKKTCKNKEHQEKQT